MKKDKKKGPLLLSACIFVVISCLCLGVYGHKKNSSVDLDKILVDTFVLPEGWAIQIGPLYTPFGKPIHYENESVLIQFENPSAPSIGAQLLLRYSNSLQATIDFFRITKYSKEDSVITDWVTPAEWEFIPAAANRFKLSYAVVISRGKYTFCEAVMQYDEYISIYRTSVGSDFMSLEKLKEILKAIDERMQNHLLSIEEE